MVTDSPLAAAAGVENVRQSRMTLLEAMTLAPAMILQHSFLLFIPPRSLLGSSPSHSYKFSSHHAGDTFASFLGLDFLLLWIPIPVRSLFLRQLTYKGRRVIWLIVS